MNKSYTHDGAQIELDGYLAPSLLNRISGDKMNLRLYDASDRNKQEISSSIRVNFGQGANGIYFPDNAKEEEIELYDNEGQKLDFKKDKVKIAGKVVYTNKGPKAPESEATKRVRAKMGNIGGNKEEEGDGNDYTYVIEDVIITKL